MYVVFPWVEVCPGSRLPLFGSWKLASTFSTTPLSPSVLSSSRLDSHPTYKSSSEELRVWLKEITWPGHRKIGELMGEKLKSQSWCRDRRANIVWDFTHKLFGIQNFWSVSFSNITIRTEIFEYQRFSKVDYQLVSHNNHCCEWSLAASPSLTM